MEVLNIKVKQFTVNEFFENLNISVKLKVSSFFNKLWHPSKDILQFATNIRLDI